MLYDHRGALIPEQSEYYEYTTRRRQHAGARSRPIDEDRLIGERTLQMMRLECADLGRVNSLTASALGRFADNVVGPNGIRPQAKTVDDSWNQEAEEFFAEWAENSDVRGRLSLTEIQKLVVQARLLSGDCGFILTDTGHIQPIDAERIETPKEFARDPNVINGIRKDSVGRIQGYYILRRTDRGALDKNNYDYRSSRDSFIVENPSQRFDKYRSTPELWPVVSKILDYSELAESTLVKAKMDAATGHVITKLDGAASIPAIGTRARGAGLAAGQRAEKFDMARINYLLPGEDMKSFSSNTPNPQFVEYCELQLREISAGLQLPYDFFMLDFKKGSFSASRAALIQTQRTFEMWQSWAIRRLLKRIWNWRIAMAIRNREIKPAPIVNGKSQWSKVEWSRPEAEWIDPQAEATADELSFKLGKKSLTQILRKQGTTTDVMLREKAEDIRVAMDLARELSAGGEQISWRDLIQVTKPGEIVNQQAFAE